jgi:predicted nucleic acid-binding protein
MRLVVNASPLIFLAKVGTLSLLNDCFEEILTPPAIVSEVGTLRLPEFVRVAPVSATGSAFVRGAVSNLHTGELEVMVLAQEAGIAWVALDDMLARRKAKQMGLHPIGTVGILLLAQKRGLLDAMQVRAKIEDLVGIHGLYLSDRVLESVWDALK